MTPLGVGFRIARRWLFASASALAMGEAVAAQHTIKTIQVWRLQPDGKWRISRTLSGRLADLEPRS